MDSKEEGRQARYSEDQGINTGINQREVGKTWEGFEQNNKNKNTLKKLADHYMKNRQQNQGDRFQSNLPFF